MSSGNGCPNCERLEKALADLQARFEQLERKFAACDKTHVCTIPPEIRFVVIDRKVTQGSKSESGQRWLERIWTVLATCTAQDKSLLNGLRTSLQHFFRGERPPPLLPAG